MTAEYEVVWPLGRAVRESIRLAPRLPDLAGKTICELSHFSYRGDEVFPAVEDALKKRYPDIKFVDYKVFGNFRHPPELESNPGLRDLLLKHNCDAVIAGMGA
jgi:hypothetical protein